MGGIDNLQKFVLKVYSSYVRRPGEAVLQSPTVMTNRCNAHTSTHIRYEYIRTHIVCVAASTVRTRYLV